MSIQKTTTKTPPDISLSKEYRRGDMHRHHIFDFHPVIKHHPLPYHDYLVRTTYESLKGMGKTRIGKLVSASCHVMRDLPNYEITVGPLTVKGGWTYLVTKVSDESKLYNVAIEPDGSYTCNCPASLSYNRNNLPCKHVILIACLKGHEIKI